MNGSGVSAIVLAAGLSSRMGSVKPLARVGEKTMLERVLTTLRESRVDETIVVLGHAAELIRESLSFGAARAVMNVCYQQGMSSSIRLGLASVRAESAAALIVLADQPFLKAETVDLLIEEYQRKGPEIVIPVYKGIRGNPVLVDRSIFAELAELTGDIGCRAIFGSHADGIVRVAVDDAGVSLDLDTAEDLSRFGNLS